MRTPRVVTALALAAALLVTALAPGADAVESAVTVPAADNDVDGLIDLTVAVTTTAAEQVKPDSVLIRFLHNGVLHGSPGILPHRSGPTSGGTGEWSAALDPLASWMDRQRAMPNGLYEVQTQVTVTTRTGDRRSEWRGHAVRLKVAPAPTATTVTERPDRSVEVVWQAAVLPDFVRYQIERSQDEQVWTTVLSIDRPDVTRMVDTPPPGTWHYRARVVRSDGAGGELISPPPPGAAPMPVAPPLTPAPPAPMSAPAPGTPSFAAPRGAAPPQLLPAAVAPLKSVPGFDLRSPAVAPFDDPRMLAEAQRNAAEPDLRLDAVEKRPDSALAVDRANYELLRAFAGGMLLMVTAGHVGWQLRRPVDDRTAAEETASARGRLLRLLRRRKDSPE